MKGQEIRKSDHTISKYFHQTILWRACVCVLMVGSKLVGHIQPDNIGDAHVPAVRSCPLSFWTVEWCSGLLQSNSRYMTQSWALNDQKSIRYVLGIPVCSTTWTLRCHSHHKMGNNQIRHSDECIGQIVVEPLVQIKWRLETCKHIYSKVYLHSCHW